MHLDVRMRIPMRFFVCTHVLYHVFMSYCCQLMGVSYFMFAMSSCFCLVLSCMSSCLLANNDCVLRRMVTMPLHDRGLPTTHQHPRYVQSLTTFVCLSALSFALQCVAPHTVSLTHVSPISHVSRSRSPNKPPSLELVDAFIGSILNQHSYLVFKLSVSHLYPKKALCHLRLSILPSNQSVDNCLMAKDFLNLPLKPLFNHSIVGTHLTCFDPGQLSTCWEVSDDKPHCALV